MSERWVKSCLAALKDGRSSIDGLPSGYFCLRTIMGICVCRGFLCREVVGDTLTGGRTVRVGASVL